MVRHIVAWNYKEGFSPIENSENGKKIKSELEKLIKLVDGIVELRVYINELPSGNSDLILNSLFESEEALSAYQIHPEHQRISSFIGTVTQNRICIDYAE